MWTVTICLQGNNSLKMKEQIKKQLQGKKILFATVPAEGQLSPPTGLAKFLQDQGCEVRWYTSVIFAEKLEKLGIHHYPYIKAVDINQINFMEILPERETIHDPAAKLDYDMIHVFANRSEEYYQDIQDLYETLSIRSDGRRLHVLCYSICKMENEHTRSLDRGNGPCGGLCRSAPYGMALPPATNEAERAKYAEFRNYAVETLFKRSIDNFDAILKSMTFRIKTPCFSIC